MKEPKYGLHFELPCHLPVPLSFQVVIVKNCRKGAFT